MCKPDVSTYLRTLSDHRISTQDCGFGIDGDVIAHVRMTLDALYGFAVFALRKTQCTKGNALVDLYVLPNSRCLAYDNTRAVIDEETRADLRTGVNVDSRA